MSSRDSPAPPSPYGPPTPACHIRSVRNLHRTTDTSEALDTVLDLTVESLEAVKDIIVDALSMPGIDVALDAAIAILKKAQVRGRLVSDMRRTDAYRDSMRQDTKSNHDALRSLPAEMSSLVNTLHRFGNVVKTERFLDLSGHPRELRRRRRPLNRQPWLSEWDR